jgi:hypothetical protein
VAEGDEIGLPGCWHWAEECNVGPIQPGTAALGLLRSATSCPVHQVWWQLLLGQLPSCQTAVPHTACCRLLLCCCSQVMLTAVSVKSFPAAAAAAGRPAAVRQRAANCTAVALAGLAGLGPLARRSRADSADKVGRAGSGCSTAGMCTTGFLVPLHSCRAT